MRLFFFTVAMATLAACASPREHLYSLDVATGEVPPRAKGAVPTIELGPLSLPELADRPQMVVRDSHFTVRINEQERWAAPLKDQLLRVLSADLDARFDDRRVVPTSSAAIKTPVARLAIEISRFDLSISAGVTMKLHWVYHPTASPSGAALEGDASSTVPVRLAGYSGLVDATNQACSAVAAQIAQELPAASPRGDSP